MAKKTKKEPRKRGGASVLCPTCSKPSQVVITRRDGESSVRRVRECTGHWPHQFTTLEEVLRISRE